MASWNIHATRVFYVVLWLVVNTVNGNIANLTVSGQWICPGHIHGHVFNCSKPMDGTDLLGSRLVNHTCLLGIGRNVHDPLVQGQCYLACTPEYPYVLQANYWEETKCGQICPVFSYFTHKYKRDCGEETCDPSINLAADKLQCVHGCPRGTLIAEFGTDDVWCLNTCPKNMYTDDLYCVEQCRVEQFIVNGAICAYECPDEAPWIVRAECPGGCPQNCVKTCPEGLYEHDQVCVDQCPDFVVNNRVCVDQCPENTSWSVGRHCMEECPLIYVHTVDQGGLNVCNSQLGAALVASTSCLILHSLLLIACCVIGLRHRILNMDKNTMKLVLEHPNVQDCEVTDTLETGEVDQEIEELGESTACV